MPEGPNWRGPEIRRRFEEIAVKAFQRGVYRKRHEREVGVNDADIDCDGRVVDDQGLVDHAEADQEEVEQALLLQDADPCVDADEETRPEGKDQQHHQSGAMATRRPGHAIGKRKGDEERKEVETAAICKLER